jgi:transglutaminase-like putative cysteine protease
VKYRVRHVTTYDYHSLIDLGAHMAHLWPRSFPGQIVHEAVVGTSPMADRRIDRLDHFGNRATWLFIDHPHRTLDVTLNAVVEADHPPPPDPAATPDWESVRALGRGAAGQQLGVAEYSFGSPMAPAQPEAGVYAAESFPPGRPILAGLLDLTARIYRDFMFRPGVTQVNTAVEDVLRRREGVCQDFSHLMISGLRALGLPARYVSGYIRTLPPPGGVKWLGSDQSHAWVGAWLGPAHGWVGLDPTNDLVVRNEHVVLGWGRDYADVSPVRGVILGAGGHHQLLVSVDLEAIG